MNVLLKRHSKRAKIALIAVSALAGTLAYFAAYARFESKLTDWQKSREIDIQKNTGSTKFKAHIDALTIGGLAFCATSGIIIIAARTRTMFLAKKRDGEKHL